MKLINENIYGGFGQMLRISGMYVDFEIIIYVFQVLFRNETCDDRHQL